MLSLKLRYISYVPQRRKLKERNNSVFGMAIEIHGRITASGVHSFLLKIHKYVATVSTRV